MVRVNDRYGINVEENNYTVVQFLTAGKNAKNKGKEYFRSLAYCSTFTGAIEEIDKHMVRDKLSDGDMSLDEAVRTIQEAHRELLDSFDRLGLSIELKHVDEYDGTKI